MKNKLTHGVFSVDSSGKATFGADLSVKEALKISGDLSDINERVSAICKDMQTYMQIKCTVGSHSPLECVVISHTALANSQIDLISDCLEHMAKGNVEKFISTLQLVSEVASLLHMSGKLLREEIAGDVSHTQHWQRVTEKVAASLGAIRDASFEKALSDSVNGGTC